VDGRLLKISAEIRQGLRLLSRLMFNEAMVLDLIYHATYYYYTYLQLAVSFYPYPII